MVQEDLLSAAADVKLFKKQGKFFQVTLNLEVLFFLPKSEVRQYPAGREDILWTVSEETVPLVLPAIEGILALLLERKKS